MELGLGYGTNSVNARSGSWESWDSGVAIISSRTKNMSVEGAQFVTFLKVESQRTQGRSGFVLICRHCDWNLVTCRQMRVAEGSMMLRRLPIPILLYG